jgi:2-polyprenyl-3-methyl-5-hydroxy-6-metoxy-1,4-benzoquinol methylase
MAKLNDRWELYRIHFHAPKGSRTTLDKAYAGNDPIFIQSPSAVPMSAIEGRKPGKALDIGMGQGRNSVCLASQGWDVTGFDPSSEAVRIARSNAEKAGGENPSAGHQR